MVQASLVTTVLAMSITASAAKTNFVVLFMDDNGWGDSGLTNSSVTETPRINKMASEGIHFTDFHSAYSVCTASRAALLTGRLAPRTGVFGNFGPTSEHGMALGERTIANWLEPHGYDSHMIGKWHLGHNDLYHPTYRGFTTYTGLPYSGDMGCLDLRPMGCDATKPGLLGSPACPVACPPDNASDRSDTAIPLYATSKPWDGTNCSGRECNEEIMLAPFNPNLLNEHYVARASEIFDRYGDKGPAHGTPFFLYVAFAHTHTPMGYAPKWENTSRRPLPPARSSSVYGNTLAEVDGAIGAILDSIDSNGLGNDTLVFLAADNGPADLGSVNCWAIGSPGPYQGLWQKSPTGGGGGATCKGTTWEGGHRITGVARWLGGIKNPGRTSHALAMTVDYLPTFMSIAGLAMPTDRAFDGVDLTPVLLNTSALGHTTLFHPLNGNNNTSQIPAMRYLQYKAHFNTAGAHPCIEDHSQAASSGQIHHRLNEQLHDPPLIFDLDADPAESTPVDPSTIPDIVASIKAAYSSFWNSVDSTLRHSTDYSSNSTYRPCNNQSSSCCRYKERNI